MPESPYCHRSTPPQARVSCSQGHLWGCQHRATLSVTVASAPAFTRRLSSFTLPVVLAAWIGVKPSLSQCAACAPASSNRPTSRYLLCWHAVRSSWLSSSTCGAARKHAQGRGRASGKARASGVSSSGTNNVPGLRTGRTTPQLRRRAPPPAYERALQGLTWRQHPWKPTSAWVAAPSSFTAGARHQSAESHVMLPGSDQRPITPCASILAQLQGGPASRWVTSCVHSRYAVQQAPEL